ncbi:hypothetical protein [Streptomyces lydicamycinicus]|uniref:hypothetical protein n=1 Tax=Streptomyces lydicamycinicus TaxID=1546107 RepID=UPI003C306977
MADTLAETLEQQYERLATRYQELRHVHPSERTADQAAELRVINQQLTTLLSTPPAGYALPKVAADLITHAKVNGWLARTQWTYPGFTGQPYVKVEVGRRLTGDESPLYRGTHWLFVLTWHSRGCSPGKLRMFGNGLAETPENPASHDGPSVKAIRAVITDNPAPDAVLALF